MTRPLILSDSLSKQSDDSQGPFHLPPCANAAANWCSAADRAGDAWDAEPSLQALRPAQLPLTAQATDPSIISQSVSPAGGPTEIMCATPTLDAPLSSSATCTPYAMRSTRSAPSTQSFCDVTVHIPHFRRSREVESGSV